MDTTDPTSTGTTCPCSDAPDAATPACRIPRWSAIALPAAVFLITCVAFLPAARNEFVSLDDHKNFQKNHHYRGLGPENIKWAWTTFHNGAYQPLSWMLFSAEYVAWGLNPTGYHVVSVLLQAVNGVLFYWVALRLLALAMPAAGRDHPDALRFSAGLAALLFSVHPLRTEAVAWLSTQPYLPVGLFYLLSILAYLRACGDHPERRGSIPWLALSCLLYGCSILSKGVGVALVVVLVLLDVYPLRRLWPGRRGRHAGPPTWVILLEKAPFLIFTIASALLALRSKVEAMVPVQGYDIPHRVVQAAWGVMFYLYKTVLPFDLSPWYQFRDGFSIAEPQFVVSAALVVAITIAAVASYRRWLPGTVLWAYYLIALLPLTHLVKIGRQAAADRYTYVACMGWAILGGAGLLAAWSARCEGRLKQSTFKGIAVASAVVCAILAGLSWEQSKVWRDGLTLWTQAVRVSPGISTPRNNLSQELRFRGDLRGAMRHLNEAIRLAPRQPGPLVNRAAVLLEMGRPEQAMEDAQAALRLDPNNAFAFGTLGVAYLSQGRVDEAITMLTRAVGLGEKDTAGRCNLANALIRKKRYDEAVAQCERILALAPDQAEAHNLWGMALIGKGQVDAGLGRFRTAIAVDPDTVSARTNLAHALRDRKAYREAIDVLVQGAKRPDPNPQILAALARELLTCPDATLRNPAEAAGLARRANDRAKGRSFEYRELLVGALAASGAADEAVKAATEALELAGRLNQAQWVERFERQLESLRQHQSGVR
ncbi:MAG: tetratricopeptide repeat protein [Phycisphaerae bacterium]|nr:tetratricopeptide repeat protein [Phycisphaerae bacterium]